MEKQILSIKDFVTICGLLNREITRLEDHSETAPCFQFGDKFGRISDTEIDRIRKEQKDALLLDPYYQDLTRLNKSLRELTIEVQTPPLKIEA